MQGIPHSLRSLAPRAASTLVAGALLMGGSSPSAQSIQTLLTAGDVVPGVSGTLSSVTDLYVTDSGQWIARVTMAVSGGSVDAAILNGAAVLIAGDALFDPPGVAVMAFDELALSDDGTIWWNISTDGTAANNEVLYRNLVKISQEGTDLFDPNQPSGTIWKDFDGFNLNENGDLLVLGDIDSPAVSGASEGALVQQTFDSLGNLATENVLVLENDVIPGITDRVKDVGTNSGANDVAHSNNHWIAYVRNTGGSSSDEMVYFDGAVVAQEGKAGPLIATTWKRMSSNAVDVTNDGTYVFRGEYTDIITQVTFECIFINALPVLSSGDTSDSIAPFTFASFGGNTPIKLAENGNLCYFAKTDNTDPNKSDGYFINDRYLIQRGVTVIDGNVLTNLITGPNGLNMSPNGRYVIAQATNGNSDQVVMLVDLGEIQVMASSTTAKATLTHTDGLPVITETLTLQMDGEQDMGVTPFLMVSTAPIAGWASTGSGIITSFGELLIDVTTSLGNPAIVLSGPPSDFSAVDFQVTIPNDLALAGRDYFAQGFYWDIGDVSPQENFRLTNGLQISVGK